MVSGYKMVSNVGDVNKKIDNNINATLNAWGLLAVEITVDNMRSRYGKPIHVSGDLMRSISHKVASRDSVIVGSNLNYATSIHEGRANLKGRPYLKDALTANKKEYQSVAEKYLSKGF
jgi:phage gpG-like protein